jgi:hypothetical protein
MRLQINFWVGCTSYLEWSEIRRCFIVIAFQLWFRIRHQKDPRKQRLTGTDWNTQLLVYADDFTVLVGNVNIMKKSIEAPLDAKRK